MDVSQPRSTTEDLRKTLVAGNKALDYSLQPNCAKQESMTSSYAREPAEAAPTPAAIPPQVPPVTGDELQS